MSADVDNFLEHYGVKGMKWGKRNRVANREILRKAGHERLANSGGSAVKANWKSVGKAAAVNAVTNVGGTAIIQLSRGNPTVRTGVTLIAGAIQIGAMAKSINEIRAVNEAQRDLGER